MTAEEQRISVFRIAIQSDTAMDCRVASGARNNFTQRFSARLLPIDRLRRGQLFLRNCEMKSTAFRIELLFRARASGEKFASCGD